MKKRTFASDNTMSLSQALAAHSPPTPMHPLHAQLPIVFSYDVYSPLPHTQILFSILDGTLLIITW